MKYHRVLHDSVSAALDGRWGSLMRNLSHGALRLLPETRAVVLAREGHLERAHGLLAGRNRLGRTGRRVLESCKEALDFLNLPLPSPPPRTAVARPFNGRLLYALHSSARFDPSGYAARSDQLILALQRAGVTVRATTRLGYPWDQYRLHSLPHTARSLHAGVEYHHRHDPDHLIFGSAGRYIEAYARYLEQMAREHDAGVLQAASNYLDGCAANLAARRLAIPSVYEMRGLWHLTRAGNDPAYAKTVHYRYCERRELAACLGADHVLVLSNPLRRWLIERGVPAERIELLGNAAVLRGGDTVDRLAARAVLGLPGAETIVGYAGAFARYEGLQALVGSAARLPADARVLVVFAGDGEEEQRLRAAIAENGVQSRVRLIGRLPAEKMPEFYAACDAIVLPRLDESLTRLVPALKPFEALAAGVPVFVSRALDAALEGTLDPQWVVLEDPPFDMLAQVLQRLPNLRVDPFAVPSWDDRAAQLVDLYKRL